MCPTAGQVISYKWPESWSSFNQNETAYALKTSHIVFLADIPEFLLSDLGTSHKSYHSLLDDTPAACLGQLLPLTCQVSNLLDNVLNVNSVLDYILNCILNWMRI